MTEDENVEIPEVFRTGEDHCSALMEELTKASKIGSVIETQM